MLFQTGVLCTIPKRQFTGLDIPVGGMQLLPLSDERWIVKNAGTKDISVKIDPEDFIAESREDNNEFSTSLRCYDYQDDEFRINLAYLKPTYSSSIESNSYLTSYAVDGNYGTRWSSAFNDPQDFVVNLQGMYTIYNIRIHWETAYSSSYNIQVSTDSINWQNLISVYPAHAVIYDGWTNVN